MKRLGQTKREAVGVTELVRTETLLPGGKGCLMVCPAIAEVDLVGWAAEKRDFIRDTLLKHGSLLFRDFSITGVDDFEKFLQVISEKWLDYSFGSTPRSRVRGHIYTSTEYPANQSIPLHNEMAYADTWPMKICFYCVKPADEGGATPHADARSVYQHIKPSIRERFEKRGVMYVRNFGSGLDLSWQKAFETEKKSEVEKYCRAGDIDFEWITQDHLRIRHVRPAIARHPQTGDVIWFNQAHLFHVSALKSKVRESLLAEFPEEDLPRNACFGDGSAIDTSDLDDIRKAYQRVTVSFDWKAGDIFLLDNMLVAHGRLPFAGERQVLVGMADPFSHTQRNDQSLPPS